MNIIICGAGQIGSHTAEVLAARGNNITVIDTNADRLRSIEDTMDVATIRGNCADADVLTSAGARDADLMVAFSVSGQPRTDVVGGGGGYYGWGGSTFTTHYVVGRLVIDIFDNRIKKLLWHGWADKEIFESS